VPIGLKKNGELRSDSNAASLATFQLLEDYLEQLLVDAGLNMTSGQIMLDPYEYKQRTACTFCDFKSVCQFDPTLEENDFRRLKAMKDDEVRSEEHTSELQSRFELVCRLLLEKK